MSPRLFQQSKISSRSIESTGKNNIDYCDWRREGPSLPPITNRLAADPMPARNKVDNCRRKDEVRHKFQIHCNAPHLHEIIKIWCMVWWLGSVSSCTWPVVWMFLTYRIYVLLCSPIGYVALCTTMLSMINFCWRCFHATDPGCNKGYGGGYRKRHNTSNSLLRHSP